MSDSTINCDDAYDKLQRCITFLLEQDPSRATHDCVIAMADLDVDEQIRIAREVRNGNVATFDELVKIPKRVAAKPAPTKLEPEAEVVEPSDIVEPEEIEVAQVARPKAARKKAARKAPVKRKRSRKKKLKKSTSWVIQCRVRLLRDKVNQLAAENGGCEDQLAKCHAVLDDLIAKVRAM